MNGPLNLTSPYSWFSGKRGEAEDDESQVNSDPPVLMLALAYTVLFRSIRIILKIMIIFVI